LNQKTELQKEIKTVKEQITQLKLKKGDSN